MVNSDDPFNSIHVDNWDELLKALHADELFPQWEDQGNHHRSPYVFRGTDKAWGLQTSLERLGSPADRVEDFDVIQRKINNGLIKFLPTELARSSNSGVV